MAWNLQQFNVWFCRAIVRAYFIDKIELKCSFVHHVLVAISERKKKSRTACQRFLIISHELNLLHNDIEIHLRNVQCLFHLLYNELPRHSIDRFLNFKRKSNCHKGNRLAPFDNWLRMKRRPLSHSITKVTSLDKWTPVFPLKSDKSEAQFAWKPHLFALTFSALIQLANWQPG